jgi:mutator protein MutT
VRIRQRLAAYALVIDDSDRVLLARQPDGRRYVGRWSLPGGGVEPGEHPAQAVVREAREETGLDITVGALREVISDVVTARRRALHTVRLIYLATAVQSGSGRAAAAAVPQGNGGREGHDHQEGHDDREAHDHRKGHGGRQDQESRAEPGWSGTPRWSGPSGPLLDGEALWCTPEQWQRLPLAPFTGRVLDSNLA